MKEGSKVDAFPDGIANEKTGTAVTATIHIFCAIVGAGVLALPHSVAWLGWVAGPICIIAFYLISLFTSHLLTDVYEVDGTEHSRYHHAVKNILGGKHAFAVSASQLVNIFLFNVAYSITAGTAMKEIATISCSWQGKDEDDCFDHTWAMTLIFGVVEIGLSQVPSLEEAWWVSALGVITSLTYSVIGMALGIRYGSNRLGTVGGISASNLNKGFGVLNALSAIAFAYSFSLILLEIQDTLHQPPKAAVSMKKAVNTAITGSFFFYFIVAVAGYAALGNDAPGFMLAGFPQAPRWVILLANICILLHMVAAYQVFGQPMFDTLESHVKAWTLGRARRTGGPAAVAVTIRRMSYGQSFTGAQKIQALVADPEAPLDAAALTAPDTEAEAVEKKEDALAPESTTDEPAPAAATAVVETSATSEARRRTVASRLGRLSRASLASAASSVQGSLRRASQGAAMYHADTGFANEAMPSNDEHFLIPLWQRLVVRSIYVVITTVVAIIMPFFSDIIGLVGALTFFPLAVFFPIHCWRAVYRPVGHFNRFLWALEIIMLAVCLGATIAAFRSIINNWGSYKIFGT